MNVIRALMLIAVLALVSCATENGERGCLKEILRQNDMVRYLGEDVGCNTFLRLYEYNGQQYFLVVNHCADMVAYPFDCDGNIFCDSTTPCTEFYAHAENKGIMGIRIP